MTQEVVVQLLHYQTTTDLWNGVRDLTCASTKARVMVIKSELHNTQKNELKMEDYLNKMKNLSDELALAGSPVAIDDLILNTLNGLDTEYNLIIVKLIDQLDLTWVEAQAALLSFETRLNQLNHFSTLSIQPSINAAATNRHENTSREPHYNRGGGRSGS
ncbi:hypothetical protein QN277_000581 [Acacia crassicarpa]|uniref:Uncharacterized protein n=1 Tax=Acacia crassicarpa TaxID=499986 RepID=A0AAE1TFX7_9FABA|nr:hypothetical protein QN277_000581 [Acacia crassicarpa]